MGGDCDAGGAGYRDEGFGWPALRLAGTIKSWRHQFSWTGLREAHPGGVYVYMAIDGSGLFAKLTVLAIILMTSGVIEREYSHSRGTPVLLAHRCTHSLGGDRDDIVVRYRQDHSSTVNHHDFMPVEGDLRRKIAGVMATRAEQVLYFSAVDELSYGEVARAISDLREDDPEMAVVLLTKSQIDSSGWAKLNEFCLSSHTDNRAKRTWSW